MTAATVQDPSEMREALQAWLRNRLPDMGAFKLGPLVAPHGAGFSAETFFVDAIGESGRIVKLVVRRQLLDSELFMNADLGLQANAMSAFAHHPRIRVPSLTGFERSSEVLGAPFLVMEKIDGRIVPQTPNYNKSGWLAALPLEKRTEVWGNGIRALAELHKTEWSDKFAFLAKPSRSDPGLPQYLTWVKAWLEWAAKGRQHPVAEAAVEYLERYRPKNAEVGVIWGDAIPANILFGDDLSVNALLDWEMVALGPGEADLAWWLYFDELFSAGMGVERLPGLPDRQSTIALYESCVGKSVGDLRYYDVLARLRMAIVSMRAVDRQVDAGRFKRDNDAWVNNPTTASLARTLEIAEPAVGPDFFTFVKLLLPS